MRKLTLFLFFSCLTHLVYAQGNCLDEAKQAYSLGEVKRVKTILEAKDCISSLGKEKQIEAYYLLCTTALFLNEKEQATAYMLKLLKIEPEFAVEPTKPVEFKQFHESFNVSPIITVGLRMGINLTFVNPTRSYSISNMLPDSKLGEYNAKGSYQFGLQAQIPLLKQLDLNAELTYRSSSYQYQNTYLEYVKLIYNESQKYLEIPLLLKYNFKNKFDFTRDRRLFKNKIFPYISLGATLSRLSNSTGIATRLDSGAETTPLTLKSDPEDDMITARNLNKIFASGAVGIEYKSGRSILALEVRYNRMFGIQVKPEERYQNQEFLLKYAYIDNDFRTHNAAFTLSFLYPLFLTGGTGLLGQYLLPQLLEAGFKVRALCRNFASIPPAFAQNVEWVQGDLHNIPTLEDCVQGCSYIIHGAGKVSYHASDKKELYATNVEGTANLVNVALDFPVRKFLFISSIAALGRNKDRLTIDENAQWQETDLNTYYAKTKYLAELEVWRGVAEGLPALVVHPSVVLGAGKWEQSSTQIFHYVWKGKRYYPTGQLSYVDVRDVAEIITRLLPTDIVEERFIINAGEASYLDLFTQIAEKFGKKPPNKPITPFLGEIAWRLASLQGFFTATKPIISRETVRLGRGNFIYTNKKVKDGLDFNFRSLNETLEWACKALQGI